MVRGSTSQAAEGKWHGILLSLGVDEQYLTGNHTSCPICKSGKDKFRYDDKGKGMFYCNSCGAGTGWKLLELIFGWEFKEAARRVDKIVGNVDQSSPIVRRDPLPRLKRISSELIDITECDSVMRYLESRKISDPPSSLKAHPGLAYYQEGKKVGEYAAMVARIVDPKNEPLTLHCTYTHDGKKLINHDSRKIMPPIRSTNCGSAVRLFPAASTLGISEGIETALAATKRFGIPTWAAIHSNGLKGFQPPENCETIVIYADNDHSFTGQAAGYELARRLHGKFKIQMQIAPDMGTDWADHV